MQQILVYICCKTCNTILEFRRFAAARGEPRPVEINLIKFVRPYIYIYSQYIYIYQCEDHADITFEYDYLYFHNYNDCYYMPCNTSTNSLGGLAHAIQKVTERITVFWVEKARHSRNGTPPYAYIYMYMFV